MTQEEACEIILKYESLHGLAPQPFGFPIEEIAEVLQAHMEKGLPKNYNWWSRDDVDYEPEHTCHGMTPPRD